MLVRLGRMSLRMPGNGDRLTSDVDRDCLCEDPAPFPFKRMLGAWALQWRIRAHSGGALLVERGWRAKTRGWILVSLQTSLGSLL